MATTLGERLKKAREERGVSLREISDQTRIATRYLEAIENNEYKVLPGGVFNKGFIKSFAKYVGVDDKEALDEYTQMISQQGGSEEEEAAYDPRSNTDLMADNGGSQWLTMLIAFGILAALTGLVFWFVRSYQSQTDAPAVSTNANSTRNSNVALTNANSSNANVAGSNSNISSTTLPPTDSIKVELKASPEAPSYSFVIDGAKSTKQPQPNEVLTFTPQQSISISFYKGLAANVQLSVNGKPITLPPATAVSKNSMQFVVDKSNIAQILQSGQITIGGATPNATVAPTR